MKNITIISLLLVLLTACAAPTPSPTATVIVSPSATSSRISLTPTADVVTATATASGNVSTPLVMNTATPDIYSESDLDWKYIEEHRLPFPEIQNINGVVMQTRFGFDSTIQRFILKTQLHEGWKSDDGNSADIAFAAFTQRVYYDVYVSNQKAAGNQDIADFTTYMSWVSAAQKSGLAADYEKIAIWIQADTTVDDTYFTGKTKVIPMYKEGGRLPEGAILISNFEVVVVNADRVKNIEFHDDTSKYGGVGASIYPDGRLVIYLGPTLLYPDTFSVYDVAAALSFVGDYLSTGSTRIPRSGWGDTDLLQAISVKKGDHISMFFQIIDPATKNELRDNR